MHKIKILWHYCKNLKLVLSRWAMQPNNCHFCGLKPATVRNNGTFSEIYIILMQNSEISPDSRPQVTSHPKYCRIPGHTAAALAAAA